MEGPEKDPEDYDSDMYSVDYDADLVLLLESYEEYSLGPQDLDKLSKLALWIIDFSKNDEDLQRYHQHRQNLRSFFPCQISHTSSATSSIKHISQASQETDEEHHTLSSYS